MTFHDFLPTAARAMQRCATALGGLALCACAAQQYQERPISATSVARSLEARSLDSGELRACVTGSAGTPATWPPRKWSLDSLTAVAFCFNPSLEAAHIRMDIADAALSTASQRPNPTLQLPLQKALNPHAGDSPWTLGLALDIPVETAGKRAHRLRVATYGQKIAQLDIAGVEWQVRSQLRAQLLTMWFADERVQLLQRQAGLDERIEQLLARRAAVGDIATPDVIPYRILRDEAQGNAQAALEDERQARLKICALIGVRPTALVGADMDVREFGKQPLTPPAQELWRQALLNRADVQSALTEYEASQALLQLEVARQYPDLHLGPGYTLDQGVRKAAITFSGLELPLFNRNEGPIAEAAARRREAETKVRRLEALAFEEADLAQAAHAAARVVVEQRTRQVADAKRKVAVVQAALRAGEADRLSQLGEQKYEIDAELAQLEALFRLQQAAGQLENSMQRPLGAAAQSNHDTRNPE